MPDTSQPVATLGDVHVAGRGRPVTGPHLRYAVTVRRPCPVSGALEHVAVSTGMGLHAGDILTSRAYVTGVDLVFGDRVEELVGRSIVAHEVTHVIQQGGTSASPMNTGAIRGRGAEEAEGAEDESTDDPGTTAPHPTARRRGTFGPRPFEVEGAEVEATE